MRALPQPLVPSMYTSAAPQQRLSFPTRRSSDLAGHLQAALDSGVADIIMGVDYRVSSGPQLGGLAFRLTDANNHLVLLRSEEQTPELRSPYEVVCRLLREHMTAVAACRVRRMRH